MYLAYDQGLEHGPVDFNDVNVDPAFIMKLAKEGGYNGVIFQKGIAEKYYDKSVPLIVKLNGKTNLVKEEPYSPQLCSVKEAIELGASAVGYTIYVAYEKEENKPVAFGFISYVPNTKCAVLNGAATLPKFRKRGIYSAMLKKRYEQAKGDGIEHLIIQAKEATSAPIATKNGFEKVCELPVYVWRTEINE